MKAAELKSSTTSNSLHAKRGEEQSPFFDKEGANGLLSSSRQPFFSLDGGSSKPFFSKTGIQTKLTIGKPGDKYEQEADAMADQVVQRLAENNNAGEQATLKIPTTIQRKSIFESEAEPKIQAKRLRNNTLNTTIIQPKCADCEAEEQLQKMEEPSEEEGVQRKPIFESAEDPLEEISPSGGTEGGIQRKCAACEQEEAIQPKRASDTSTATRDLESRLNSSKGGGSPLPDNTRNSMGSAMGADFSSVRVHIDSSAVQMNKELGAQAFTHGSDVYFNSGKYDTGSASGQELLAHELVHTVQQRGGVQSGEVQRQEVDEQETAAASEDFGLPTAEEMEGNSVPDDTSVEETHSTDCPQLVPPYPTEQHDEASSAGSSPFDELIRVATRNSLLGGVGLMGLASMAAEAIWNLTPNTTKIQIINTVLDLAIQGMYIQRVIGNNLLGGSLLRSIMSSVLIGFYRELRNMPDEQKLRMFNRHLRIILGGDVTFSLHYLKGIVMGFFLDGLVGIIQMIIDVICFIPRLINFFSSLVTFIRNIPNELRALGESLNAMMTELGNFLENGTQEIYEIARDPARIAALINTISNSIILAAESVGASVARTLLGFANRSSAALGEIAGRIVGQVIFEAVLTYFTAGGGAAITAAKTALRFVGQLLMRIGRYIFRIVRFLGGILSRVKIALRSVMQFLTRIMTLIVRRVGEVIDRILEFFGIFRRYCRPGSIVCMLPIERPGRGFWRGTRGNGVWHSTNPAVRRIIPEGIVYRNGFPIFPSRIIRGRVRLDGFASRSIDMREASRRLGERMLRDPDLARSVGLPSGDAQRFFSRNGIFDRAGGVHGDRLHDWLKSKGNVWHHHQGGREMQLIPRSVHSDASHAGGIAALID